MTALKQFHIGDARITKIVEQLLPPAPASFLLPQSNAQTLRQHAAWLGEEHLSPVEQTLRVSCHGWLVQTATHTVIIDTASGNHKNRPLNPLFHQQNTPWLENLRQAGVAPEDVDYVLLTHLHVDHVGWNTRWVDGKWVPTFPNARYVYSAAEYDFYADPTHVKAPSAGVFEDSVQPVVDAGLGWPIGTDQPSPLDGFQFHPTRGHSHDHLSISYSANGEVALFAGDVMHHPIQIAEPQWNSVYCEYPEAARQSRRWVLDFATAQEALYCSSHFAGSSAGRITRLDDHFVWHPL